MASHTEELGRFKVDISYRRFSGDRGLSLTVRGPVSNEYRDLLRFDCFDKSPHYHVEVYGKNEITAIKESDSANWSLTTLKDQFEELVNQAGADPMSTSEKGGIQSTMQRVDTLSRALIETEEART